jgi:poly(A) polymerase
MDEHFQALAIVKTLNQKGFTAYYAGGWVRDFLLNHPSDDIDIATDAPPHIIQEIFPHTIPIGLAFGIILVIQEGHQYEVATFRQDFDYKDGRRPSKIQFCSAEEDAKRRDFTINGMFYDPLKEKLIDYVGGQKDLKNKIIRAIGDPHERIKEDRLRMIRAIRLKCRFHFTIEPATEKAIKAHAKELFPSVAIERITQELAKGLKTKSLFCMLTQLHAFHLLGTIFPPLEKLKSSEIEKRLQPTQKYPSDAPLIIHLLSLFPELSLIDQLELCKKLKTSRSDEQFVSFLFSMKEQIQNEPKDLFFWAKLYAHPLAQTSLEILSAHLDPSHLTPFQNEHKLRREKLKKSIERIQNRNPVVQSTHLLAAGIKPSKAMGLLLEAAEKISINEQIEEVLPILKNCLINASHDIITSCKN